MCLRIINSCRVHFNISRRKNNQTMYLTPWSSFACSIQSLPSWRKNQQLLAIDLQTYSLQFTAENDCKTSSRPHSTFTALSHNNFSKFCERIIENVVLVSEILACNLRILGWERIHRCIYLICAKTVVVSFNSEPDYGSFPSKPG